MQSVGLDLAEMDFHGEKEKEYENDE
jgi:hypothetical protein